MKSQIKALLVSILLIACSDAGPPPVTLQPPVEEKMSFRPMSDRVRPARPEYEIPYTVLSEQRYSEWSRGVLSPRYVWIELQMPEPYRRPSHLFWSDGIVRSTFYAGEPSAFIYSLIGRDGRLKAITVRAFELDERVISKETALWEVEIPAGGNVRTMEKKQ